MGDKGKLVAKVLPATARQEVRFISGDPNVLKINETSGEWEAITPGGVTVTAEVVEDPTLQAYVWFSVVETEGDTPFKKPVKRATRKRTTKAKATATKTEEVTE